MQNIAYQDHYDVGNHIWPYHCMTFDGNSCEKLFACAPTLKLLTGPNRLNLSTTGFTQWMIWNPGPKGSHLADLSSDDWQTFLCIESVIASKPIWLEPGETFLGTLLASFE